LLFGEHHGDGGGYILWSCGRQWMEWRVARARFFHRRCPDLDLDALYRHIYPTTLLVSLESYQAKASCFGTDGGDACGCRFPLEDVVEVFFPVTGF
jgi:hypothetical protein